MSMDDYGLRVRPYNHNDLVSCDSDVTSSVSSFSSEQKAEMKMIMKEAMTELFDELTGENKKKFTDKLKERMDKTDKDKMEEVKSMYVKAIGVQW